MLIRNHLKGVQTDQSATDIIEVARCIQAKQEGIIKEMKKKFDTDLEQIKTYPVTPIELQARLLAMKNKGSNRIRFARDWYSYGY